MARNNADFQDSALYHGTAHPFQVGDIIEPQGNTNWKQSSGTHVYTTTDLETAKAYAEKAAYKAGVETKKFEPRVFQVEPVEGSAVTPDANQRKELFNPDARTWFKAKKVRVVKEVK